MGHTGVSGSAGGGSAGREASAPVVGGGGEAATEAKERTEPVLEVLIACVLPTGDGEWSEWGRLLVMVVESMASPSHPRSEAAPAWPLAGAGIISSSETSSVPA